MKEKQGYTAHEDTEQLIQAIIYEQAPKISKSTPIFQAVPMYHLLEMENISHLGGM